MDAAILVTEFVPITPTLDCGIITTEFIPIVPTLSTSLVAMEYVLTDNATLNTGTGVFDWIGFTGTPSLDTGAGVFDQTTTTSPAKRYVWDGAQWVRTPEYIWNGSSWQQIV